MANKGKSATARRGDVRTVDLGGFLAGLEAQRAEIKDVSEQLKEIGLETKLLSLSAVAIDRETEVLREMVEALKPAARRK